MEQLKQMLFVRGRKGLLGAPEKRLHSKRAWRRFQVDKAAAYV